MRKRKNLNRSGAMAIDDAVRITSHDRAPHIGEHWRTRIRKVAEERYGSFHFRRQRLAQTRHSRLIEERGLREFSVRVRMKAMRYHPSRRRSRANTSSPGISFTSPPSIWEMRRSISRRQASSTSASEGPSSDSIRDSASSARSASDNWAAFFFSSVSVSDIGRLYVRLYGRQPSLAHRAHDRFQHGDIVYFIAARDGDRLSLPRRPRGTPDRGAREIVELGALGARLRESTDFGRLILHRIIEVDEAMLEAPRVQVLGVADLGPSLGAED